VREDKNGFPVRFLPLPSALSRIHALQLGSYQGRRSLFKHGGDDFVRWFNQKFDEIKAATVERERFLNRGGRGAENIKYKFRFASKFAKHLHQPVFSMGVALGDFGDLLPKYSIFRHVSAEILSKNLPNLFIIVHLYIKCSILAIILFKY